jgi:hypothetical protein
MGTSDLITCPALRLLKSEKTQTQTQTQAQTIQEFFVKVRINPGVY